MAAMASVLPAHLNARQSRRSACDRCRAYKLRCQRDDQPGQPCERCAKARSACKTTFGQASGQASHQSPLQAPPSAVSQPQTSLPPGGNSLRELLPSPANGAAFASLFPNPQGNPCSLTTWHAAPNADSSGHASQHAGHADPSGAAGDAPSQADDMLLDPGMNLDMNMSGMQFDAANLDMFINDSQSPKATQPAGRNASQKSTANGYRSRGSTPFLFGELNPSMAGGGGNGDAFSWDGLFHDGFTGSSAAETNSNPAPDNMSGSANAEASAPHKPSYGYSDVLRLSSEIYGDQEELEVVSPLRSHLDVPHICTSQQQFTYINRMLDQGSRFWDILKAMAEDQREPAQAQLDGHQGQRPGHTTANGSSPGSSGASGHGGHSSSMHAPLSAPSAVPDHLLVIQLTLTYVYLVRSCRAIYVRLFQALEITPAAESLSLLRLPSLKFGEFQLENNLAIQIKLLVELMSAMLLRIGDALGISPVGILVSSPNSPQPSGNDSGVDSGVGDLDAGHRGTPAKLVLMRGQEAVAVRDGILAGERAREEAQQDVHTQPPPLLKLIQDVKRLMGERYSLI